MENKAAASGQVSLNIGGKDVAMPILKGSLGPEVVDIRKMYGEADVLTYDIGFTSRGS